MRCAIYARFSSERQNVRSLEDQVRVCREYAARQEWQVAPENIYLDEAVSGRSEERPGYQAMMGEILRCAQDDKQGRPFDCILVDDTSRISRDQADALRFYERLAFAGVRLVAVSQGVDSSSEQADLMLGVHGLIDAVYSKELAQKTHRGMSGAALRGTATGGRCFGYRTSGVKDQGSGVRGGEGEGEDMRQSTAHKEGAAGPRYFIYEPEAEIVRRMFAMSADGRSVKKIARLLNGEGVATPRAYRGQRHASWSASAVSVMLRNARYAGEIVWNKTRKVRNPETGRRVRRWRPRTEWMRRSDETLRIVEQETFQRVQARLMRMRSTAGACLSGRRANYLLSGLLECGVCGSKMVLVSGGRGRTSVSKYGCPLAERGVCAMRMRVAREPLERRLLDALVERLSEPAVLARIESRARRAMARERAARAGRVDERSALKLRIERLAELIAAGNHSPALLARLRQMEAEYAASRTPTSAGAEHAAVPGLRELKAMLNADRGKVKDALARCVRLTAMDGERKSVRCAVWVGAGGQNRTESARPLLSFELAA